MAATLSWHRGAFEPKAPAVRIVRAGAVALDTTVSSLCRRCATVGPYEPAEAVRVTDLDGDGRPELVTGDDAFAYAFTAYAFSYFPLVALSYDHGTLRDVTTGRPAAVAADAAKLRGAIRRERDDKRGVIAAYVADEYRLGRRSVADRLLRGALQRGWLGGPGPWPHGRRYITALRRFLRHYGYG